MPDGKVQVIGGDFDSTMEIYDPAIGRFTALAHLAPTAELFARSQVLSAQTRAAFVDARGYRDPQIKRPNAKGSRDDKTLTRNHGQSGDIPVQSKLR